MSHLKVEGFKASDVFSQLGAQIGALSDAERAAQVKKTGAIIQIQLTNVDKQVATWTLDFKKEGAIYKGTVKAPAKAGVTLIMSDETFSDLASGKLDGQKAFMTGKLKSKGNIMLAAKLGALLGGAREKAKL
ncbi:SCP2 sterol-binding domain-containing protein [Chiua virens]|nr:SCP2 sterol-binding domain-containing protein [Chiua virens]